MAVLPMPGAVCITNKYVSVMSAEYIISDIICMYGLCNGQVRSFCEWNVELEQSGI